MDNGENLPEIPESTDWKIRAEEIIRHCNTVHYLWKTFDESQLNLIKAYVGLMLFSQQNNVSENDTLNDDVEYFERLFNTYDEMKKSVIVKIVEQFQFDDGRVNLSSTFLYLSKDDLLIFLFRQMRVNGDVNFIETNGRVYTSWDDFVKTNKLPKCEYMAPKYGIHSVMSDEFEVHESPACSQLGEITERILFGTFIASLVIPVAPVIPLVCGVSSATYGAMRSVTTLYDRSQHNQSISPFNLESFGCYMNITTSAACGASTLALAESARIIQMSGKYGGVACAAMKAVHITAVSGTFVNFGLHLIIMKEKLRDGDLSFSDVFELSINIFLIYGAVTNLSQMREYLSNLEVNPTPPKSLSKSARRRWRKRQAKLLRTGTSSSDQNIIKAGDWDPKIFKLALACSGSIASFYLSRNHPTLYRICTIVLKIYDDIVRFSSGGINPKVLCDNIINHFANLWNLLKENSTEIRNTVKSFFRLCGYNVSPEVEGEIGNIIDDGLIAINNVNDEILLENDSTNESVLSRNTNDITYEMILSLIKHRIRRKEINTTEKFLSSFAQELSCLVDEIKLKILQQYDKMLSSNVQELGEKKTKMLLSRIGINSKNDFADKIIDTVVESLKNDELTDVPFVFEKQLDELFLLYRELFLTVAGETDISSIKVLETCDILHNSIEKVIQPLTTFYQKSKEIYEINFKFFGHVSAVIFVLGALDLDNTSPCLEDRDDLLFIRIAVKKLNMLDIVPQLLPSEESATEPLEDTVSFTDDFKIEALLNVCDFYVQKMESIEITKIYSFITDKFIDRFQSLANERNTTPDVTEKLKCNTDILGKTFMNQMCRLLCETNEFEIFIEVVEDFMSQSCAFELITEYHQVMGNVTNFHAAYFKHIMEDEGITIYEATIKHRDSIEQLKQQAADLFSINKYLIDVVAEYDNLVILKSNVKYVVFQFMKNKTEARVMQIDLSKKNEEN